MSDMKDTSGKTKVVIIAVLVVLMLAGCVASPVELARARAIESAANQDAADRASARALREAQVDYTPLVIMFLMMMFVGVPVVAVVGCVVVYVVRGIPGREERVKVVERVVYVGQGKFPGNIEQRRLVHNRVQEQEKEIVRCIDAECRNG